MTPGKWTKSTYSATAGQCVEVKWTRACSAQNGCIEVAWTRAEGCSDGMCVEVGHHADQVLVRDSKDPDGPTLVYTTAEWDTIVRTATFARPGCLAYLPAGCVAWVGETADEKRVWLEFTLGEIDAWVAGVRAGEFRRPSEKPAPWEPLLIGGE